MSDQPEPQRPSEVTHIDLSEKGITASASIVGMTPTDEFIAPVMNLDGPPPTKPDAPSANE